VCNLGGRLSVVVRRAFADQPPIASGIPRISRNAFRKSRLNARAPSRAKRRPGLCSRVGSHPNFAGLLGPIWSPRGSSGPICPSGSPWVPSAPSGPHGSRLSPAVAGARESELRRHHRPISAPPRRVLHWGLIPSWPRRPVGSLFDVDHIIDVANSFRSRLVLATLITPTPCCSRISAFATDHSRSAIDRYFWIVEFVPPGVFKRQL
jgi:hypothetical protein